MTQKFPRPLGELEQCIMDIVWQRGHASGREVFSACRKKRDIAYTTVMTVMNRLVEKGILERKEAGKQYLYRSRLQKDAYERQASGRIIKGLIHSFGDLAISQFVDTLDETDPAKLKLLEKRLRTLRS